LEVLVTGWVMFMMGPLQQDVKVGGWVEAMLELK
jgi:hypothetical protein